MIVEQTVIDALGHTEVTDEAIEPTCTKTGLTEGSYCVVCGEVLVEQTVVEALGHTEVTDEAVEPTCTGTGLTEGKHCSVCGETIVERTVVDALGHSWNEGEITTPPTETADGVRTYTCTVCGETKTETIPATGVSTTPENPDKPDLPSNSEDSNKPDSPDNIPDDTNDGNITKEVKPGDNVPETTLETPLNELIKAVLTPNEQEITKDGIDIRIILTVEDATDKVSSADKTAVEKAIGSLTDYKPGQYLDINLFKVIDGIQNPITETKTALTITFETPSKLRGSSKMYSVIRVHDGETTVLEDKDNDSDTVTIETDKFSTYALAYSENAPAEDDTDKKTTVKPISPHESNPGSDDPALSEREPNESVDTPSSDSSDSDTTSPSDENSSTDESDSAPSESKPDESVDTPSNASSDNDTTSPSDGNSSTDDSVTDSGDGTSSSDDNNSASSESVSADNSGNPSTGIAISLVPLAAAVTVLMVTVKRKKK